MTESSIGNVYVDGAIGGTEIPAMCQACGRLSKISLGISLHHVGEVNVSDVVGECQNCGSSTVGLNGTYEFAEKAYLILKEAKLSRQQIRQFERKAKKSDNLDALARESRWISPVFEKLTQLAQQQINPKISLQTAIDLCWKLLAASCFAGQGLLIADDVRDRYMTDELFEQHAPQSDQVEDKLEEKPEAKPKDGKPPRKSWGQEGGTEV